MTRHKLLGKLDKKPAECEKMGGGANKKARRGGAAFVAAGILASRLVGLVRERVFAHYFGSSEAADAFKGAIRIPNVLQNLFGEGVLSASFIPVYSRLRAEGREREAQRLAWVVGSLLLVASTVVCSLGVVFSPLLIGLIAPGFTGEKRELAIRIVQILFPGMGLLVLSAWCLGVLNSHRRFFLPYVAPVLWSLAIIGALIAFGGSTEQAPLAVIAAWGVVVGSALQLLVQLPAVFRELGGIRFFIDRRSSGVGTVLKNFVPVVGGRGVVQISAWIDSLIASLLPTGAVAALGYAQTTSMLPISLFGMSISAAELPELSSALGSDAKEQIQRRINRALSRVTFFVVPTVVSFLVFGDLIVGALYQTGSFTADDTRYVWAVLAGSSVGLVAATSGRLYASTLYALQDTRTPLRIAFLRVTFAALLGAILSLEMPNLLGLSPRWGIVGITLASGIGGWIEYLFLKQKVRSLIGDTGLSVQALLALWASALGAAGLGFTIDRIITASFPLLNAYPVFHGGAILGLTAAFYLLFAGALQVEEANRFFLHRKAPKI